MLVEEGTYTLVHITERVSLRIWSSDLEFKNHLTGKPL